jgi:hypothetical protein
MLFIHKYSTPFLTGPSRHFTSLHFTSLHFTSLHFTSLHFTSLHFTSLHITRHSTDLIHLLKSSTCFEHYPAHLQEVYVVIVYMQPLVLSLSAGDCPVHRLSYRISYIMYHIIYHIIWYISYHIISYHIISHIMSCHVSYLIIYHIPRYGKPFRYRVPKKPVALMPVRVMTTIYSELYNLVSVPSPYCECQHVKLRHQGGVRPSLKCWSNRYHSTGTVKPFFVCSNFAGQILGKIIVLHVRSRVCNVSEQY